ncbi:hypothetical protein ACEWY4_002673 [Coilia grayii]|uniref:Cerebellar degeneration-related protein 2-like n=1 Tax=Coilia grayii TaxID=363190 RepID=A0ABD1KNY5_9TELE
MLTDVVIEEDFELRGEDLWYSKQDLENDLHLAAELGKTLLDRNHELEQSLQQMYTNNQEQLQEIEYLTKQMDVLRQMNEQHAKVYEQLDGVARDLEQGNRKLVMDNRNAQQRIQSLTETVDTLQSHMEDLQEQVEQLTMVQSERARREQALKAQRCSSLTAQSVPCLKDLYDIQQHRCLLANDVTVSDKPWLLKMEEPKVMKKDREEEEEEEEDEERTALLTLVQTLEAQLEAERSRRREAEQEVELTVGENGLLGQRLAALEGCQARQAELEAEVEELRQLWRAEVAGSRKAQRALPDDVFLSTDDQFGGVQKKEGEEEVEEEDEEEDEKEEEELHEEKGQGKPRQRSQSEGALQGTSGDELRRRHRPTCARRPRALWGRGVSLLSEVDAQYSALQRQYDELLRRSQLSASNLTHKAVQTPGASPANPHANAHAHVHAAAHTHHRRLSNSASSEPPEYKALFVEIFNCIQKTKGDLSDTSVHALQKIQMSQSRSLIQPSQTDDTW